MPSNHFLLVDQIVWNHNVSELITLKDAFIFKESPLDACQWAKNLWYSDIPSSKSLFAQRLAHDKIPTKVFVRSIYIFLASLGCLCNSSEESGHHLFFHFSFAKSLWNCPLGKTDILSNPNSLADWFLICNSKISNQYDLMVKVAFIFTINQIWIARNKLKHNNLRPNNIINLSSILIMDIALFKAFGVQVRHPRAPNITVVLWSPPNTGWVKGNCVCAFCYNTNVSGCGGIFKNNHC